MVPTIMLQIPLCYVAVNELPSSLTKWRVIETSLAGASGNSIHMIKIGVALAAVKTGSGASEVLFSFLDCSKSVQDGVHIELTTHLIQAKYSWNCASRFP